MGELIKSQWQQPLVIHHQPLASKMCVQSGVKSAKQRTTKRVSRSKDCAIAARNTFNLRSHLRAISVGCRLPIRELLVGCRVNHSSSRKSYSLFATHRSCGIAEADRFNTDSAGMLKLDQAHERQVQENFYDARRESNVRREETRWENMEAQERKNAEIEQQCAESRSRK